MESVDFFSYFRSCVKCLSPLGNVVFCNSGNMRTLAASNENLMLFFFQMHSPAYCAFPKIISSALTSALSHSLFPSANFLPPLLSTLPPPPSPPPQPPHAPSLFNLCTVSLWLLASLLQSLITMAIAWCLLVWKCGPRQGGRGDQTL